MDLRTHNISGRTFYVADLDQRDEDGNPIRVSPWFWDKKDADLYRKGMLAGFAVAKGTLPALYTPA